MGMLLRRHDAPDPAEGVPADDLEPQSWPQSWTESWTADFTIEQVVEYLELASEEERAKVIDAEKAGKARKGVLSWMPESPATGQE